MDRRYTTGHAFLEALAGESNEVTEMVTLAVAIADQGCRFDLEYGCTFVMLDSGEWIDTANPSPDVAAMPADARERYRTQLARALRYLDLRGHLLRNPSFPTLIRFSEEQALH